MNELSFSLSLTLSRSYTRTDIKLTREIEKFDAIYIGDNLFFKKKEKRTKLQFLDTYNMCVSVTPTKRTTSFCD